MEPDLKQVQLFFEALTAAAHGISGLWVLASFTENAAPDIYHVPNDENAVNRMVAKSAMWAANDLNVYVAPALFRTDLEAHSKGKESDVVAVAGFCCDFDDEHASDYLSRLPVAPSIVVETSKGRFQCFILFDRPVLTADVPARADVKRVLTALIDMIGKQKVDPTSKDLSHVFRVPGTLNFPNAKKIKNGRSPIPQLARIVT